MGPDTNTATLHVLGRFELRVGGRLVALSTGSKRVLAYLAVAGPVLRRETLAGRMWEWSAEARANANLRNELWRIRRAEPRLVETDHDDVRLGDQVVVDLDLSVACARQLLTGGSACVGPLLDGRSPCGLPTDPTCLLEADILPDWDEEWVLLERERHRQLRIHALEAWSAHLIDAGRFAEAIHLAYAAIAAEPLRESAHEVLIRAHLAEGNRIEALRQFETYRRMLHDQLAVPPSPQVEALVRQGRVAVPLGSR